MRVKRKLISVHLEIVLVLVQDRCTVCAEQLLGDEAQVEARFSPFGDSIIVGA